MTRPYFWMDGTVVVAFRCGVRVYRVPGGCTARCGIAGCPDSPTCRAYQVYQMYYYGDGTREWRGGGQILTRTEAIKNASDRALFEEAYADKYPEVRAAINRSIRDGAI